MSKKILLFSVLLLAFAWITAAFPSAQEHPSGLPIAQDKDTPADPAKPGSPVAVISEKPSPVVFKSKRPLFGKIALTEDGSKVLSIASDESGGTRTGHDILYGDLNFNGQFEESERLTLKEANRHGTWLSTATFAPLDLDVPYNKKAEGIRNPCQLILNYRQYPRAGVAEDFSVAAKIRLRDGDAVWEYSFTTSARPSKTLKNAAVCSISGAPRMELTAKPDGRQIGNLGIGLELLVGEDAIECRKDGQPVKAHVEIKKPNGEVVHQGDDTLDRFTFG